MGQIPREHFDILKQSGILNPDVTLEQIIDAAAQLDESFRESEASVPTLIGNWYVYHTLEGMEAVRSES